MSGICPCTMGNSVSAALNNFRKAKKMNQVELEQTMSAAVLARRVETIYSLSQSSSSWAYLVKFRLDNGEELELQTTEEQYGLLKEGREGTLTWQGMNLITFC